MLFEHEAYQNDAQSLLIQFYYYHKTLGYIHMTAMAVIVRSFFIIRLIISIVLLVKE